MDIHRCRFVPYQPQSINAVAFSHISTPRLDSPRDLRLALGRANGDIEIWNPNRGEWTQERIFRGSVGRTIEQIHWTQDLISSDSDNNEQSAYRRGSARLFSTGGSNSITEWDVEKGLVKKHANSNAGDIWCFAPQPQWTEAQSRSNASQLGAAPAQILAAGCSDGTIVLFSTVDDELQFDKILARPHSKKSRCISITWRDRNTVVAGFEESLIRVIDIRNKQTIRTITVGKSKDALKPLIWQVKCLPNGTILSGDSSGELKIWDSQNYSLVQRLKTHLADILDIATNVAGTLILTCGVDQRTVAYAPTSGVGSAKTQRWSEIRHRRFHEHDVKVIASYESKSLSVAVSGGLDTVPVVMPLKNWNDQHHRSLSHLPQRPQMSVSPKSRMMLTWWNRDLLIWHLPHRYQEYADTDSVPDDQFDHQLLTQIQLRDDEFITSAAISKSGTMVVAATNVGVKLFQLRKSTTVLGKTELKTRPIELTPAIAKQGASHAGFSPDNKWLYVVRLNNVVVMVKISSPSSTREPLQFHKSITKLDRKVRKLQSSKNIPMKSNRNITSVSFSSDGRIIAVGDLSGAIDTWVLEGHEATASGLDHTSAPSDHDIDSEKESSDTDSDTDDETDSRVVEGQKWVKTPAGSHLPSLESAILTLAFRPSTAKPVSPAHVHGNEGLHATRHNQHPVAPEYPSAHTGMLFAVTANHQIVEFDVINCRLSDWSRRNPTSLLPDHFRKIKDRVMGIWFDRRPAVGCDRLWLYGTTFIFMLDLNKDLQRSRRYSENTMIKIGRIGRHVLEAPEGHALVNADIDQEDTEGARAKKRRKRNNGAGDEMSSTQMYTSTSKVRRSDSSGKRHDADIDMDVGLLSPTSIADDRSDYGIDDESDVDNNGDMLHDDLLAIRQGDLTSRHGDKATVETVIKKTGPATWHSFQYRGIFGICPMQQSCDDGEAGEHEGTVSLPEVVIVERPTYDVELVPRFSGPQ